MFVITNTAGTSALTNCWARGDPFQSFTWMDRAPNSSAISSYAVNPDGSLRPISTSSNIDITASADGRFLYSLNAATGAIGMFAIQSDGALTKLGTIRGLPASAGLNCIAAN